MKEMCKRKRKWIYFMISYITMSFGYLFFILTTDHTWTLFDAISFILFIPTAYGIVCIINKIEGKKTK